MTGRVRLEDWHAIYDHLVSRGVDVADARNIADEGELGLWLWVLIGRQESE